MDSLKLVADLPAELPVHATDINIVRADGWGETVAVVSAEFESPAEVNRRALLLAAAPELLYVAESALWLMERVAGWEDAGEPITKFAARRYREEYRAAIAKARGEASGE